MTQIIVDIAIATGLWVVIFYAVTQRVSFNRKKNHFKGMLKNVQTVIWEKELSQFKALGLREAIRSQYDGATDGLQKIEAEIKGNVKVEENKEAKKKIEQSIKLLKDQIDDVDATTQTIVGELEATIQLREHIKGFIKYNT